jgi:hypothetical protein
MHPSRCVSSLMPRVIFLSLVVGAIGCEPPEPPNGFYVWCYGDEACIT